MDQSKESFTLKIRRKRDTVRGAAKVRGKETGLGICEFIGLLFEANEKLPKSRKMTDAEIKDQIIREFEHAAKRKRSGIRRLIEGKIGVGYYRTMYNKGILLRKIPEQPSRRYSIEGEVIPTHPGPLKLEERRKIDPAKVAILLNKETVVGPRKITVNL